MEQKNLKEGVKMLIRKEGGGGKICFVLQVPFRYASIILQGYGGEWV
jgi:hypothetical protein